MVACRLVDQTTGQFRHQRMGDGAALMTSARRLLKAHAAKAAEPELVPV